MRDLRNDVLSFMQANGPALPVQVSKALNITILFASAVLSELVSSNEVFMSSAKIGGSSLYYIKGQEAKLEMLREHLGSVPKKAYDILKQKQVLRDKMLEPAVRVALRELKDFAIPLSVKCNGEEFVFWKWFLMPDENVTARLNEEFNGTTLSKESVDGKEKKEEDAPKGNSKIAGGNPSALNNEKKEEKKEEKLDAKIRPARQKRKIKETSNEAALSYFKKNGIEIISTEPLKKGEIIYSINLPSQIGLLQYLAYFKDKKKISQDDLIIACHEGQQRKLPTMLISTGDLAKQAEEYLNKNLKGSLLFKKI